MYCRSSGPTASSQKRRWPTTGKLRRIACWRCVQVAGDDAGDGGARQRPGAQASPPGGRVHTGVLPAGAFSTPHGASGRPRAANTSASTRGRSVIRPSTPRSSSSCIVVGVVDRPHVHVESGAMRGAHEGGRHDRRPPPPDRDLQAAGAEPRHPPGERRGARGRHRRRAHRRARAAVRVRADALQAGVRERAEADAIPDVQAVQEREQRPHRVVGLGVDVDAGVRPAGQQLLQPRDADPARAERERAAAVRRVPRARVCSLDLVDGQLRDRPGPVRLVVQPVVVEGHDHAVARHVRVGLQVAVAQRDRRGERLQRVLGRLLGPAAMRDRDRRPVGKEGMRARHPTQPKGPGPLRWFLCHKGPGPLCCRGGGE